MVFPELDYFPNPKRQMKTQARVKEGEREDSEDVEEIRTRVTKKNRNYFSFFFYLISSDDNHQNEPKKKENKNPETTSPPSQGRQTGRRQTKFLRLGQSSAQLGEPT